MKTVAYLALTLLLSPIVFAMEQPNLVKFNMGGHKFTIALEKALEESEYLKILLDGKFARPTGPDGRIFIQCSIAVAEIFEHYMNHHSLLENADPKAASDAADFFQCDGLKKLIPPKKEATKWLELTMGYGKTCRAKGNSFYICPLCSKQIDPTEAYYLAHLIKSHDAKIVSFNAYGLSGERRYHIVKEYPSDKSSPVDDGYSAELWVP